MEVQVKFIRKTTVWIRAYVYDEDGNLVDPTSSIKVTVEDSAGAVKVNDQAMAQSSTGIYDYYYTLQATDAEGWWQGEVWTTDGTYKSCEPFGFEVRAGL